VRRWGYSQLLSPGKKACLDLSRPAPCPDNIEGVLEKDTRKFGEFIKSPLIPLFQSGKTVVGMMEMKKIHQCLPFQNGEPQVRTTRRKTKKWRRFLPLLKGE
jgi:hypothetical protein